MKFSIHRLSVNNFYDGDETPRVIKVSDGFLLNGGIRIEGCIRHFEFSKSLKTQTVDVLSQKASGETLYLVITNFDCKLPEAENVINDLGLQLADYKSLLFLESEISERKYPDLQAWLSAKNSAGGIKIVVGSPRNVFYSHRAPTQLHVTIGRYDDQAVNMNWSHEKTAYLCTSIVPKS